MVSCGECSSSATSDITEPGSPCSTSSDEGVAVRGTAPSPLPTLPKLAPLKSSTQNGITSHWPWAPPLATITSAFSTFKRLNGGENDSAAIKQTAITASETTTAKKVIINGSNKINGLHSHESQGKITEYFKTQIKPQQPKVRVKKV